MAIKRKSRRKAKARRRGYKRNAARKTAQPRYKTGPKKGQFRPTKRKKSKRKSAKRRKGQTAKQRAASLRNIKKAQAANRRKGTKRKSSKRKGRRRSGSVGLKFARKTRRGVKKVRRSGTKRAKAFAVRHKMRSNPGAMVDAMKQVLPIAVSFYGTRFVSAKVAQIGPVGGILAKLPMGGKLAGPVMSGAVLAGIHFGTKKGALSKHRTPMMLGAAFALIDSAFSAFAPASVASQFGVPAVAGYFPTSEYVPQSEYVAQSDYVAMSGYDAMDQAPRQLHEVWGVHGIEEELGSDYGSLTSSW
jgi:hypothetical protein